MFGYYIELAWRGFRRNIGLTALMVLAIGFGIAASATTYAVFRAVSGDPIPWKSARLYVPQIDPWGPSHSVRRRGEPPDALTYLDATRLMHDHRGHLQSAMYAITPLLTPSNGRHPFNVQGHAVYGEFFPMLDVPFHFGSGWNIEDDEQHAAVAVISNKLNQRLFGGANSVGRTLNLEGKDYRIIGVLDDWNPQPLFYDIMGTRTGGFTSQSDDFFVPFTHAIEATIQNNGFSMCTEALSPPYFWRQQHSSCTWVAFLVQLDSPAEATVYGNYLRDYAREQQQAGRFGWPPNVRLRHLMDWMDYHHVVPSDSGLSLLVAVGLLVVCLVNSAGVLLGKFLRRDSEIRVRRTLGAPRIAIYTPFLIEAAMVGAAGGVLGLLLTWGGLASLDWILPKNIAALARLDAPLLAMALLAAIVGSVLAALYPTFRVAGTRLAWRPGAAGAPHALNLPPMLAALRQHKMGVALIALQIALSLAIVSNALFVIGQRSEHIHRPTGLDEQNLLLVSQQWVGTTTDDAAADATKQNSLLRTDLAALRKLPDVASVTPVDALPLLGNHFNAYLNLQPLQAQGQAFAAMYQGDESLLPNLGLRLIAGRNFSAEEVRHDNHGWPTIVLTKALASAMFPTTSAVGKTVYLNGTSTPSTIIGVVDRLETPSVSGDEASSPWYSVIAPVLLPSQSTLYAVRAKPGKLALVMQQVAPALYATNPMRVMDDASVRSYVDIRADAYRADIGLATLMGTISGLLLAVTAAGIAGLSSAWVSERRQQIGIRRALGARKGDISRYFQWENLLIAALGSTLGIALTIGLNLWLVGHYEIPHLPSCYVTLGVIGSLALGQFAVFLPARRASMVAPIQAIRAT